MLFYCTHGLFISVWVNYLVFHFSNISDKQEKSLEEDTLSPSLTSLRRKVREQGGRENWKLLQDEAENEWILRVPAPVAVLLSGPRGWVLKEDQEKSNAHCCWEILEGKVGVDVNDLYPLPERELLCFLHQDTGEEPPDDSNYG